MSEQPYYSMMDEHDNITYKDVSYEKYKKLQDEYDALRKQLDEWEEKEAACCPEDFGFEEVIKSLQTKLDVAISTLLYYRASGTNDWAEKALAKINKIGGVNE